MNILEKIVAAKRKEVEEKKNLYPIPYLQKSIYFDSRPVSLKEYILREDKHGIIAEFKRRSPSQGSINRFASVEKTSIGYMQAGASALSILTDSQFFGGSSEDLTLARKYNYCPILRKEFIVDEYQLLEAKSIGADAVLLIASILSDEELVRMRSFALGLGMEVLIESHNEEELKRSVQVGPDLVGINNRNLNTFEVDFSTAEMLMELVPNEMVSIAESGIKSPDDVKQLKKVGFDGFLIGQLFMETTRPEIACKKFIEDLDQ